MFDDGLRLRLESLNRAPLPAIAAPPAVRLPTATAPGATHASARVRAPSPLRPGVVQPIPGLVRRGEVVANGCGEHWRVCVPLEELWPGGEALVSKRHARLARGAPGSLLSAGMAEQVGRTPVHAAPPSPPRREEKPAVIQNFVAAFPERALLLDLETCGLSGSALFLVGLLRPIEGRLTVELLFARDYSEEPAVLASLWQRVDAEGVVVTFNGKSFDWPMVVDRSRRHLLFRGQRPPAPGHLDLLHPARRRWRGELPDCKLQTLEQRICGRSRTDDIPGSQIPAAYHEYVRTGFEREMDAILLHNAIDLVTLLDLAMRLAG
ncbi:MAG: ribonuclease H-like domain-containing protein [Planctomycetaceae bacterium]|nr:ribonuclease H-like domain-containing protein [Planctomycetaceae bacterium]